MEEASNVITDDGKREVVLEIIQQLAVLCEHNAKIDETPVRQFTVAKALIPVKNLEDCEKLQSDLCNALLQNDECLTDLNDESRWTLWDCMFQQLEFGGFQLKEFSFKLVHLLFKKKLNFGACLRFSIDSALAFIDWSNENNVINVPDELISSVVDLLEYFGSSLLVENPNQLKASMFSDEQFEYHYQLFLRSVQLFCGLNVDDDRLIKFTPCLITFVRGLCTSIDAFGATVKISNEQAFLLNNTASELLAFCSNKQSLWFNKDVAQLFCSLIFVGNTPESECTAKTRISILTDGVLANARKNVNPLEAEGILKKFFTIVQMLVSAYRRRTSEIIANFANDVFNSLLSEKGFLIRALSACCKNREESCIQSIYKLTISICGQFLSFTGLNGSFEDEMPPLVGSCIGLLSLPFIKEEKPTFCDLNLPYFVELFTVRKMLKHFIVFKRNADETKLLLQVPFQYCPLWFTHIFSEYFASNHGDEKVSSLVENCRKVQPKLLYIEMAENVLPSIVCRLVENLKGPSSDVMKKPFEEFTSEFVEPVVRLICKTFDFVSFDGSLDLKTFSRYSERYIVPQLMMLPSDESSNLHKALASLLRTNRNSLIARNIAHILTRCSLSVENGAQFRNIVKFVESECDKGRKLTFTQLVSSDSFNCIVELVTHFDISVDLISKSLCSIISISPAEEASQVSPSQSLKDELSKMFFGILIRFEEKLRNSDFSTTEKLIAVKSFARLIDVLPADVLGDAKLKALSVLKIACNIDKEQFVLAANEACLLLVKKLKTEDLTNVFLQVFVSFGRFEEKWPKSFETTFLFIVADKQKELERGLFEELAFLLDSPECSSLRLRKLLTTHFSPKNFRNDVRQSLELSLKIIKMDNADVKLFGLNKLLFLLRKDLDLIYRLVLDAENIDTIIPELSDFLIYLLSHSSSPIRYAAAVCLGELGAVDPGRLRSNAIGGRAFIKKNCAFADFGKYDTKFAVSIFSELSECLIGASLALSYNVFTYTIQEVLKFFNCVDDGTVQNSPNKAIFEELSQNVLTVVRPYLHTHYTAKFEIETVEIIFPIFLSENGLSLKQWLAKFLRSLIKKLKHIEATTLFTHLLFAADYDLNFARFLFPHVVLQKLRENDEITSRTIFDELVHVLTSHRILSESRQDVQPKSSVVVQVSQEIFSLLDFLNVWCLQNRLIGSLNVERSRVESFLHEIPRQTIVECSHFCQSYTRALMVVEESLKLKDDWVRDQPEMLQELYACLADVDSVTGVLSIRKAEGTPTAHEEILAAECLGNYVEALPYHELATESTQGNIKSHLSFVKCLLKLNQPNLSLNYLDGLLKQKIDLDDKLKACRVETLCKLQDWDSLENELKKKTFKRWGTDLAELLISAKNKDIKTFSEKLRFVREDILNRLEPVVLHSAASDRAYKYIQRLHIVSEIENGAAVLLKLKRAEFPDKSKDQLFLEWSDRLKILQQSCDVFNPLLDVRRQILSLASVGEDVTSEIHKSWLQSLRIARKTGHLQSASSYLAKIKTFNLPEAFEEEARLLWLKGDRDAAANCLTRGIELHYSEFSFGEKLRTSQKNVRAYAKALMRLTNFARENKSKEAKDIIKHYDHLMGVCSEGANYYVALFLDQLEREISTQTNVSLTDSWYDQRLKTIEFYGLSLRHGSKFLHHAMPRLLTIWLDTVSKLHNMQDKHKTKYLDPQNQLSKFNKLMSENAKVLPAYQFYSCFSQLISRFGLQSKATIDVLKEIICRLISSYPQQCLWMSTAVCNSPVKQRSDVCKEIFALVSRSDKQLKKLIEDFRKLTSLLKDVCLFKEDRVNVMNMSEKFKELFTLFKDNRLSFSNIMLPLQSLMDITLPTLSEGKSPTETFNPFPSRCVYIERFEDIIEIFQTLQRPKKISMRGSDGKRYSVLCKPKDDLRVDKRVMEFTSLVNVFLLRDPDARRRQLKIRTYAVTPLSEDSGLVEWVENLDALRTILIKIYKEKNISLTAAQLKHYGKKTDNEPQKYDTFKNELLARHPPVFTTWFRRTFPDPTVWYIARQNYVRTSAVMSMVGYVLGLGDRHGENILLDTGSGDLVHVDFNCLFNRGEELEVPEVVPFRLTHNMIDAMGPLGYDGPFRKACETTMRMLRKEQETLRSVLETFIYDPLVEWRKNDDKANSDGVNKVDVSAKGQRHLANIDLRLKGSVPVVPFRKNAYGSSLSVESQVEHLIRQATDDRLLSKMYIGWSAYM